jgi:hypothetical protein
MLALCGIAACSTKNVIRNCHYFDEVWCFVKNMARIGRCIDRFADPFGSDQSVN